MSDSAAGPEPRGVLRSSPPTARRLPRDRPRRVRSAPRPWPSSARSVPQAAPRRASCRSQGFPPGTLTGTSGLELAFNERLAGRPGGQLLAVSAADENKVDAGRVLATTEPVRGKAVRTTIDPDAPGQRGCGARRDVRRRRRARRQDRRRARRSPASPSRRPSRRARPSRSSRRRRRSTPGSSRPRDEFPVESSNSEIGREIPNAHDELCGGTFAESFAESCNTVFAPLGAEARRREAGRHRRALRLQLAAGALRRGDDRRSSTRRRARSRRRSRRASRSGSPRSARARCLRRRSRWPRSRRRSPTRASDCRTRSPAVPTSRRPTDPVEVTSPQTAATIKRPDDRRGQPRHRRRRGASGDPGRRQDRHRRARAERRSSRVRSSARARTRRRRSTPGSRPSRRRTTRRSRSR